LGSIYFFHDGNYKNAADMFGKAVELDSSNYVLWGNLASSYFQIQGFKNKAYNSYNRAIEIAEKELKINPDNPVTLSFLASYHSMLGNKEKSIQYLERSLKLSDDIDVAARNIETYETLGNRDKALNLTEKILENGYPISKLEKSPDLKDMLKDERFKSLKKKFSN
jgi:tetratricopeptide (TPR) repeat protein